MAITILIFGLYNLKYSLLRKVEKSQLAIFHANKVLGVLKVL